jgi:hypothetical protein
MTESRPKGPPRKGFGKKMPADWPETGIYRGETIALADVETTLPSHEWDNVSVEIEPGFVIRPWRGLRPGDDLFE